jgi:hypothetical protein
MARHCNICDGLEFASMRRRPDVLCTGCGSVERTRVLKLLLDRYRIPRAGQQMLHLAPEKNLSSQFRARLGAGYDPIDLSPERYPWEEVRRFDLATEVESLPSESTTSFFTCT